MWEKSTSALYQSPTITQGCNHATMSSQRTSYIFYFTALPLQRMSYFSCHTHCLHIAQGKSSITSPCPFKEQGTSAIRSRCLVIIQIIPLAITPYCPHKGQSTGIFAITTYCLTIGQVTSAIISQ